MLYNHPRQEVRPMKRTPNDSNACRICGNPLNAPFRSWDRDGHIVQGCVDPDHDAHIVGSHLAWARRKEVRAIRSALVNLPR